MLMIGKELLNKVRTIKGNLLVIGLDDEHVIKAIEKNGAITICNSLESKTGSNSKSTNRERIVSIKKIRRVFKRKRIDYVMCNARDIKRHMRYFIKDSIYICKKEVILYGSNKDYDVDVLIKRYKRYKVTIDLKNDAEQFLLTINTEKAKNKRIKEKIYFIHDTFSEISDFITDVLVH